MLVGRGMALLPAQTRSDGVSLGLGNGKLRLYLVGIQHEDIIPAIDFTEELHSAEIALDVATHFDLVVVETIFLGLDEKFLHLLIRIAQP